MVRIKEIPKAVRPREKLASKGAEKLNDSELLAIILRTGRAGEDVISLAKRILGNFPKKELAKANYQDLLKIKGISLSKAATLKASVELSKRLFDVSDSDLPFITNAEKATEQVANLRIAKREHFFALFLNARAQLLDKKLIFSGTINTVNVHPREIFEPALHQGAVSVVVVHNHPAGDVEPSREDKRLTQRLSEAGELLGVELVDHIIIAKKGHYSFREFGEL